jgi:hypothetical protein
LRALAAKPLEMRREQVEVGAQAECV